MAEFDLNDRSSLERAYPFEDFKRDAAQNSLQNAAVLHGLRITSEPDGAGHVGVTRAKQQTGERDPEGDTIFLTPHAPGAEPRSSEELTSTAASPDQIAYRLFLDRVTETARTVKFKTPLGQDKRLKGFHGG